MSRYGPRELFGLYNPLLLRTGIVLLVITFLLWYASVPVGPVGAYELYEYTLAVGVVLVGAGEAPNLVICLFWLVAGGSLYVGYQVGENVTGIPPGYWLVSVAAVLVSMLIAKTSRIRPTTVQDSAGRITGVLREQADGTWRESKF